MVSRVHSVPNNTPPGQGCEHFAQRLGAYSETERAALLRACAHLDHSPEQQAQALRLIDLLLLLHADRDTLLAALLRDSVESGQLNLSQVGAEFGEPVQQLLLEIEKMQLLHTSPQAIPSEEKAREHQLESLRRMILSIASDVRAVLVKLAERLLLMRNLRSYPEAEQRYIARETLDIFSPLANRLGIGQLKWELEDLSLRTLEPETYSALAKSLDSRRIDREQYLQTVMNCLREDLQAAGINGDVSGRPKHIYSIWRKMQRKGIVFEEIFDALAVRVLVDDLRECYTTLGLVHARWTPIACEFDDYIAAPKPNGYRSLHTAVIGPEGKQFEVQIRTRDMHNSAELGVASHWRYKEGLKQHDVALEQRIAALRELLESKEAETEAEQAISLDDDELDRQRIYVLTPQGKVITLPHGATPLDFAYAVHTSIGHRCRGAKVDGHIVPLTYRLHSGEQVEILTAREERPSRNWLSSEYLRSAQARSKVRRWLNLQEMETHIASGRDVLERELHRLNIHDLPLDELAQRFNNKSLDTFLAEIGRGDISPGHVAHVLQEYVLPKNEDEAHKLRLHKASKPSKQTGVISQGVDGLLSHTAKCCNPLPGEPVIGYITRERGIAVHKRSCPQVQQWLDEDNARLIEVDWMDQSLIRYPVQVQIRAYDRKALLRDVGETLAEDKINITGMQTHTNSSDNMVNMIFSIEVCDVAQLSRVMQRLENLSNVVEVSRVSK